MDPSQYKCGCSSKWFSGKNCEGEGHQFSTIDMSLFIFLNYMTNVARVIRISAGKLALLR